MGRGQRVARRPGRSRRPAARASVPPGVRPATEPPSQAGATPIAQGWRRIFWAGAGIEAFLLALYVVAPVGGVTQTISPLAQVWPWLLWPARLVFGETLVNASLTPERGWPELALFATLLVGASAAWGLAVWRATSPQLAAGTRTAPGRGRLKPRVAGHPATSPAVTSPVADPASPQADVVAARPSRRGFNRPRFSVRVLARVPAGLWLALGGAALLGVTAALLPSLPSDDIFSYILYGRISALHHANPLVATPASFPSDPFLSLVYWQTTRSVYGPVWLGLSALVAWLAEALGGSLAVYVALFKLLGVAAHLANVALVWAILGRIAPRQRLAGTLFYAWSPLCLLEFCASAHNDAVMLLFLLLGVYAIVRSWEPVGLFLIGLSIATKLTPIALLPLYGAYVVWRARAAGEGWRRVVGGLAWRAGMVALALVVTAAPLWAGPRTFGALLFSPPAQQLDNSLIEAISWPLRWLATALGMGATQAKATVESGLKIVALLAFTALWLWEFRRTRTLGGTLSAWGWALLWYALVASGWFWPWYVTWVVALAAIAPWGRLQLAAALLAGGVVTLYGFLPLQAAPVYGYRSFVAFGPVIAYLAYQGFQAYRMYLARRGQAPAALS